MVMKLKSKFFFRRLSTFSMVARCPKTLALGICVASGSLAVGSAVPYLEPNVGALAVQGYTNPTHGINGLKLLRKGIPPKDLIDILLRDDSLRETRQIIVIDIFGQKAAFTGRETFEWKGHLIGEDYVAAGNLLVSGEVLEAMARAFEESEGEGLAERLIKALEAGEESGGDVRGSFSAALKVAEKKPISESRPMIDLRVDLHNEPVKELRRVFEAYKDWLGLNR